LPDADIVPQAVIGVLVENNGAETCFSEIALTHAFPVVPVSTTDSVEPVTTTEYPFVMGCVPDA